MARKDGAPDHGKVKVRVIEFEMEGSSQNLRDSIRDMVAAIGRSQQIVRVPTPLVQQLTKDSGAGTAHDTSDVIIDVPDDVEAQDTEPESSKTASRAQRKLKTPKPVSVDFRNGPMPLKTFLAKAPDVVDKRYALIAHWFKKYLNTNEITQDHVYTAYLEMGWTNYPKDVGQPLRALKGQGWFDKGGGGGAYAINHIGEGKAIDMVQAMELPTA
jgi:hypothetical protein